MPKNTGITGGYHQNTCQGSGTLMTSMYRMWVIVAHTRDIDFHWAFLYGKGPRSFSQLSKYRKFVILQEIQELQAGVPGL